LRYVSLLVQTGALDEARKAVSDLPDRAFVKPFRQKLLGDIARADGQAEAALAHFGKACKLARAEGLREDSRSAKLSAEDRAAAWATHTGQALQSALQSWRDERRRRPDKGSGDNS
jgi:hypothetical protein